MSDENWGKYGDTKWEEHGFSGQLELGLDTSAETYIYIWVQVSLAADSYY